MDHATLDVLGDDLVDWAEGGERVPLRSSRGILTTINSNT
ncbi:hypothetical protein SAMN04488047_13718 [Tranquillimonas alkanivorans]|uniref:Uncharacterized protein n=1 Tax=Tranquillimonas alkanivorans TaxID=441119 RepID=A0A1I5VXM8_9RHOB|nr:hypothetical protein SAMN04488047_13718 [Tranquillimonas alkanivorans]